MQKCTAKCLRHAANRVHSFAAAGAARHWTTAPWPGVDVLSTERSSHPWQAHSKHTRAQVHTRKLWPPKQLDLSVQQLPGQARALWQCRRHTRWANAARKRILTPRLWLYSWIFFFFWVLAYSGPQPGARLMAVQAAHEAVERGQEEGLDLAARLAARIVQVVGVDHAHHVRELVRPAPPVVVPGHCAPRAVRVS